MPAALWRSIDSVYSLDRFDAGGQFGDARHIQLAADPTRSGLLLELRFQHWWQFLKSENEWGLVPVSRII
jgi:hypothetical protein